MPRSMFGILGLNPYNLALIFILLGYLFDKTERVVSYIPRSLKVLLFFYFIVLLVSFLRLYFDRSGMHILLDFQKRPHPSNSSLIVDNFINHIRYIIPGMLLVRGTQSPERVRILVISVFAMGLLLASQIMVKMVPALIGQDSLAERALRVLDRDIGYHRVDAALIMAMISAGFMVAIISVQKHTEKMWAIFGFVFSATALALTGGRAGLGAWLVACGVVAAMRQKKLVLIGPVVIMLAVPLIPGLQERIFEGFSEDSYEKSQQSLHMVDEEGRDLFAITSGRAAIWPYVVDNIKKSLFFGYGKLAMQREGITLMLSTEVLQKDRTDFGHPHNAFLELLLDNGLIGAFPVLLFYLIIGVSSMRSFGRSSDIELRLVAGITMVFLIVFAVTGLGAGSFYPKQSSVIMWCIVGAFIGYRYCDKTKIKPDTGNGDLPVDAEVATRPTGLWSQLKNTAPKSGNRVRSVHWSQGKSG